MVFFDVENTSRADHIAGTLAYLELPDGGRSRVVAVGNWRVVSLETGHLFARVGAELVHSAPVAGVKDWSDLRIATDAGCWLGVARPGDTLEIVSDDQAFDAVGDVAASLGILFRRLSFRTLIKTGVLSTPEVGDRSQQNRRRRPAGRW